MTLKTVSCIEVHCDGDGCEEAYDGYYDDGPIHFPDDPELARCGAAGGDWWSDGVVDLCADCALAPHPFVAARGVVACARCGKPVGEHDGVADPLPPPLLPGRAGRRR